jgi:hypothetical protein
VLHWALFAPNQRGIFILIAALLYGFGFGVAGFLFGKHDSQAKVRYALGPRYSLMSTLASTIVGAIWIGVFRPEAQATLWWLLVALVVQVVILAFTTSKSVKGISKKDLFR